MNKIYKTIYNEDTQTWVAVSELEATKGKSGSSSTAGSLNTTVGRPHKLFKFTAIMSSIIFTLLVPGITWAAATGTTTTGGASAAGSNSTIANANYCYLYVQTNVP